MKTIEKFFWAQVVAISILCVACATTEFKAVWKDETYQGHPARIMVIDVSNTPETRRLFEDEFVKELKDRETDAIASYTVLPDQSVTDKGTIDAKAREVGADTVLVTKSVNLTTTTESNFAPYTYEHEYFDSDTNIYDMKSSKQIWIARSETWPNGYITTKKQIQSFVKVIIRRLSEQKLIKPGPAASNIKAN